MAGDSSADVWAVVKWRVRPTVASTKSGTGVGVAPVERVRIFVFVSRTPILRIGGLYGKVDDPRRVTGSAAGWSGSQDVVNRPEFAGDSQS